MKKIILIFVLSGIFIFQNGFTNPRNPNWDITFTNTGRTTTYDLASNGSPNWIVNSFAYPNVYHLVFNRSTTINFNDLKIEYMGSQDENSWFVAGWIDNASYPCLSVNPMDAAVISTTLRRSQNLLSSFALFIDAYPLLGSFSFLHPQSDKYIYSKVCAVNYPSAYSSYREVILAQKINTDSLFLTISLDPNNDRFTTWKYIAKTPPEGYCIAVGNDNRVGIAYIKNSSDVSENKSVYFSESTNGGDNWSEPVKVFMPRYSGSDGDSLAAYRGISMVYKNNMPCLTFETAKMNPTTGEYLKKVPGKIMFWAQSLSHNDSSRCISIASEENVPVPTPDLIRTGVNDDFAVLSRPVISSVQNEPFIYIVYQVLTSDWGGAPPDTVNYKALYISELYYYNENQIYIQTPYKLTPDNPLLDWSYPSIIPVSKIINNYSYIDTKVLALCDYIPGTNVNASINRGSKAKIYVLNISKLNWMNIKNENEIAFEYSLSQNYPNPFNPKTVIKFSVPSQNSGKAGMTMIKVYDLKGREVQTLVNDYLQPGTYSVTFDGSAFSSGIYFYKIQSGDFTDTKKMVLVK